MVLVIACSKEQLLCLRISKEDCFGILELELEEAKCLFLNHAQWKNHEVDVKFLQQCLKRCHFSKGDNIDTNHYHPLALKVLGREMGDLDYNKNNQAMILKRTDTFYLK